MICVRDAAALRHELALWRRQGDTVGLVPTMGALHQGHLSLVELARHRVRRVVASVFVNPTQFGPGEDFNLYPRQLGTDSVLLEGAGCDLLFAPDVETLYPPGHSTFVDPGGLAQGLEGERRPGHFRGVATVVCALFNLVRPEVAVFGEKDAQQLAVVRRLVRDLHLGIEIVPGPTVREADGLAMSSRNTYLSADERRAATVLYRALQAAAAAVAAGERQGAEVRRILHQVVEGEPLAHLEYAEVVDAENFQPLATLAGRVVLPVAARLGKTRLIDNFQLAVGEQPAAGANR
ncbi:MAG TPA: pantoate--beta-alanine ligase [Thermoanaerobaculia bacterium]|jgi:pantoate--beta-alanine ligase|nr:pantoate--beta-alanine ligase [Thermoanaerobaculia bacterium]